MAGALEGDVFIGRRAQEFRGLLKIKYPMEHGIVTDWDDMERIWNWVYAEELGTLSEEVCIAFALSLSLFVPSLIHTLLASSSIDRSSLESSEQSRCRRSDFLRHIQRSSALHVRPGSFIPVGPVSFLQRPDN